MWQGSRRDFLKRTGAAAAATTLAVAGSEPASCNQTDRTVEVLHPRGRVPLSFIIDDSTCLVNMGHFCTPQFAEVYPQRAQYRRPWQQWPREIPDAFVRQFGEWCGEHGVKGKYSVVPNPACVGWLDRELPGWSRTELLASLKLVRELMLSNWDIHPEMITHTRVIDLKSGRPLEQISPATMENSYPREKKSVDELAAYLGYALRILKNCDLPCEGITTPGGFGNLVKSELSLAVQQSVRDVYQAEIPHYFKYVNTGNESTEPKLEHVQNVGTDDVKLTVNIPAGTGDWFGGWQGADTSDGQRYSNEDATSGRMVELIERNQPALMLCHWPGLYSNGSNEGFEDFKSVVLALHGRFADRVIWMKLSEIARYWAAKGLTSIAAEDNRISFDAPFSSEDFTVAIGRDGAVDPKLVANGNSTEFTEVASAARLRSRTWIRQQKRLLICFDLPKGKSQLVL